MKEKDKKKKNKIAQNFFNQMNYEMAAEHSIISDEEMVKNKKIKDWTKRKK